MHGWFAVGKCDGKIDEGDEEISRGVVKNW